MPGMIVEGDDMCGVSNESNCPIPKENSRSPRSPLDPKNPPSEALEQACLDTSIERLYANVYDMVSSGDGSMSRQSFGSEGDESRIDSELCHLVGGQMMAVEILEEEVSVKSEAMEKGNGLSARKSERTGKARSNSARTSCSSRPSKLPSPKQFESDGSTKSSPKNRLSPEKGDKNVKKSSPSINRAKKRRNSVGGEVRLRAGSMDFSESGLDNPDLGAFLLKRARELISGDNHKRALDYALRAAKSFEKCADGKPCLDLVMCLHVLAAVYCSLGRYEQAVPVLEHSIEIPVLEEGQDHALAKFAGFMQLGDTYSMLGQVENSINCYSTGLEIQKWALGATDHRVGETCRYLAEVHVQALQFEEAEKLCQMALDIHKESGEEPPLEETADRRLMGLICETKGDHGAALGHLVMASMAMVSNGQDKEVASVDCSIGDAYLSLARYDEAVFSYKKALSVFKSTKGENHPMVGYVFIRLADLYNRMGKFRESRSHCENALQIYNKPLPGALPEDIASGLTDVSAIYESMNEHEQAIKLLQRALKIYDGAPGHQTTIAGVEAQIGVLHYVMGNYSESYNYFKHATTKLRACGEKKSAFFAMALNHMGLACVQQYAINEASDLFEEAKSILEQEYGPYHPEMLGVYSNLAGTYDSLGRLDDAIQILEFILSVREEKLGTANPDVDDEKRRLAELLKEAGRVRNRKPLSLDYLLDSNPSTVKSKVIAV